MAEQDRYAAYITSVAGFESTLSDAQAEINRAKRETYQQSQSAVKRENGRLTSFESSIRELEETYAVVAETLAEPANAPLGASIPKRVRPAMTRQSFQVLLEERRRVCESIAADIDTFHKIQAQMLEQQNAQAAVRAREAKRAAEALAARRAALNHKPAPEPKSKKKPYVIIVALVGAAVLTLIVALMIVL
ncbi:hypothetical protein QUW48_07005 [Bifidobacterium pullorum]|uniref:hypothetical protein n=1 Tax=Bifidobacterium pullorum TaxID=78448 RepID=UPI0025A3ADDD|nr:hypothetical protein [Bifidobacterium pullorum]MDM8323283.1 hypothetical protein [Bifidobacterium pullorum]